ncbi:hypothetical protein TRVA0_003S00100 [Trichomonascus vanleenenianus]|uniref:uncharacterized protein n=1 Tax=Trichomonascus vanleenenianus TaxID=2268995 RepID=UPI003EC9FAC3
MSAANTSIAYVTSYVEEATTIIATVTHCSNNACEVVPTTVVAPVHSTPAVVVPPINNSTATGNATVSANGTVPVPTAPASGVEQGNGQSTLQVGISGAALAVAAALLL